ncbi:MAG: hypothetical protein AAF602_13015 [Myxococcota bacterium]
MSRTTPFLVLAASLVLGSGCEVDTVQFLPDLWNWDDPDSGLLFPSGQLELDYERVRFGCNDTQTAWELSASTRGPASGGTLWLSEFGVPTETHELTLVEASPDGAWDRYTVGPLLDGVSDADFAPEQTSRFDCEQPPSSVVITLRDRFGVLADCVQSGVATPETQALLDSPEFLEIGGCVSLFFF